MPKALQAPVRDTSRWFRTYHTRLLAFHLLKISATCEYLLVHTCIIKTMFFLRYYCTRFMG